MSLSRLAIRLSAARALGGATMAGHRIFDSAIDPIDRTIREERQPVIVVTTDDHDLTTTGDNLWGGDGRLELVIEVAIAAPVTVQAGERSAEAVTLVIPHTDEGLEIALDLMEHQVVAALTSGMTPWSRVWMGLVPRVHSKTSRRGATSENGVRMAARQIVILCDPINDPVPGAAVDAASVWAEFFTAAAADASLAHIGAMMRAEIEGATVPDWTRDAQLLGITPASSDAIGILPTLSGGVPVVATEVDIAGQSGWPNGIFTGSGYAGTS